MTLLMTGLRNRHLVQYLIAQGMQSMADRLAVLHEFYPAAQAADWRLIGTSSLNRKLESLQII